MNKTEQPLSKSQLAAIEPIALEETPTISSTGEPLSGFERIFCTSCWKMFVVVAGQAAPCLCDPHQEQRLPNAFISHFTNNAITTPLLRAQMTEVKLRLMKSQPKKWDWLQEFYRAEYGPGIEPLLKEMQLVKELVEIEAAAITGIKGPLASLVKEQIKSEKGGKACAALNQTKEIALKLVGS